MISGSVRRTLAVFAVVVVPILVFGCSNDAEESTDLATLGPSLAEPLGPGRDGWPSAELLVAVVKALPVFPESDAKDSGYSTKGILAGYSTGFKVTPGTSVEDIVSFFSEELPAAGWREESPPYTATSDRAVHSETVIWSFIKDELRLAIIIPLTHKDAPDGVTVVTLFLAPESNDFMSTPGATSIDATPLPTMPQPSSTSSPAPSTSPLTPSPNFLTPEPSAAPN